MLIREKLEQENFSNNERILIDFILKEGLQIKNMTTKEIANATFTSPSSLIRIAHKLDYTGWNELKEAFLEEEAYLQTHFQAIDANFPFQKNDNYTTIASKIATLEKETIDDTFALLSMEDLYQAVLMLRKASSISVFGVSVNLLIAQEFKYNMTKINKRVDIDILQGALLHEAANMDPTMCAILISYSGETKDLVKIAHLLHENHIPMIAITNVGQNSLSALADCTLRITTREKLYSKIASYTTSVAIHYLLDVLYSCLFEVEYDKNLAYKLKQARKIEVGRSSTSKILQEQP